MQMRSDSIYTGRQMGDVSLFSTHLAYNFHCSVLWFVVYVTIAACALLLPSLARTLVCLAVLRIDMYNVCNVRSTVSDVRSNWNMV